MFVNHALHLMFGTNFVILCKLLEVLNVVYMESKDRWM